jgi:hypothetical protein
MSTSVTRSRPESNEYPSFYGGYVGRVPDGDIIRTMTEQRSAFVAATQAIDTSLADHRYAPGKWSIREVLGHVADTEHVMGFRALHFARSDPNPLPGFSENAYVEMADFERHPPDVQIARFDVLRASHILLFERFDDETLMRTGTASGGTFTVRSLAWILVGHAAHHLDVLRERYLK